MSTLYIYYQYKQLLNLEVERLSEQLLKKQNAFDLCRRGGIYRKVFIVIVSLRTKLIKFKQ